MFEIHYLKRDWAVFFFLSMVKQYVSQGNVLSVVLFVCTSNSLLEVVTQYSLYTRSNDNNLWVSLRLLLYETPQSLLIKNMDCSFLYSLSTKNKHNIIQLS